MYPSGTIIGTVNVQCARARAVGSCSCSGFVLVQWVRTRWLAPVATQEGSYRNAGSLSVREQIAGLVGRRGGSCASVWCGLVVTRRWRQVMRLWCSAQPLGGLGHLAQLVPDGGLGQFGPEQETEEE